MDMHELGEDERIDLIVHHVMKHQLVVAVFVDDEPGKPERYEKKLVANGCVVVSRTPGPVKNVVTLKVGPPKGQTASQLN